MSEGKARKNNAESFVYPIAFMVILSALLTGILATLNQTTLGIIKDQENLAELKSILYALDIPYHSDDELKNIIQNNLEKKETSSYSYFAYKENGEITRYAFPINGKALWGTIDGYGGTNADITRLLGVDFVRQNETPGLGGRISEDWYKEQFRNIDISAKSPFVINRPSNGGNIDAITGATLTSNSVKDMVNNSIDTFKHEIKGGSK